MLFDTVAEYNEEITRVRTSIKRSLLVGLHSKNVSDGGTERANSEVDIDKAQAYLTLLIRERDSLSDNLNFRTIGSNW
jgi:hypothetical protein